MVSYHLVGNGGDGKEEEAGHELTPAIGWGDLGDKRAALLGLSTGSRANLKTHHRLIRVPHNASHLDRWVSLARNSSEGFKDCIAWCFRRICKH